MDAPAAPPIPDRKPLAAALTAFVLWGMMPLLFQAVGRAGATPWEILAWRTVAAVPCVLVLVAISRQGRAFLEVFARPRTLALLLLSGGLIGVNWGVYIWAVNHHHTLSTSLGYYINPLLNMAAAALLFRERVGVTGRVAIALAVAGVALQAAAVGGVPWAALALAVSFCGYSIVRKIAAVEAQTGLLVECLFLALPAVVFLALTTTGGRGVFGDNWTVTLLLLSCGLATVAPLFAFAYAARRLPLTAISFIQFLAPTMLFAIGAAQGEALTGLRLTSFGFIWLGVAVFAWGSWRASRSGAAP
jgi:chloramphenicol-sensitive protein RarD